MPIDRRPRKLVFIQKLVDKIDGRTKLHDGVEAIFPNQANAKAVIVLALNMCAAFLFGAACFDYAVLQNDIMIPDVFPALPDVIFPNAVNVTFRRVRAVNKDSTYQSLSREFRRHQSPLPYLYHVPESFAVIGPLTRPWSSALARYCAKERSATAAASPTRLSLSQLRTKSSIILTSVLLSSKSSVAAVVAETYAET